MRFEITFPAISLSDEVFRISSEEILADLLYREPGVGEELRR